MMHYSRLKLLCCGETGYDKNQEHILISYLASGRYTPDTHARYPGLTIGSARGAWSTGSAIGKLREAGKKVAGELMRPAQ